MVLAASLALSVASAIVPPTQANLLSPTTAQAQTASAQAKAAYRKEVKRLAQANPKSSGRRYARYKYLDVYGSSVEELLVMTPARSGSGIYIRIYTYSGGKVKLLLMDNFGSKSPDVWHHFYKSSNGFVMCRRGWGMENYYYYKMVGSRYKMVLSRGRRSISGGSSSNGPWGYTDSSQVRNISKAEFDARAKQITRGPVRKLVSSSRWVYMAG
jgi:hypothetical protein